jgi:hypothetical protein
MYNEFEHMTNVQPYEQDLRIRPGFGYGRRPGFGRRPWGRPGFGGFGLGFLGGLAAGALLTPGYGYGYGYPYYAPYQPYPYPYYPYY